MQSKTYKNQYDYENKKILISLDVDKDTGKITLEGTLIKVSAIPLGNPECINQWETDHGIEGEDVGPFRWLNHQIRENAPNSANAYSLCVLSEFEKSKCKSDMPGDESYDIPIQYFQISKKSLKSNLF